MTILLTNDYFSEFSEPSVAIVIDSRGIGIFDIDCFDLLVSCALFFLTTKHATTAAALIRNTAAIAA